MWSTLGIVQNTDIYIYLYQWVSDCYLTPHEEYFSYIMARTILFFHSSDDDDVHFVLDQHEAHWNNSPWVDMSLHSVTLFLFRVNQSLFLLLNDAWLAELLLIQILVFGSTRPELEPTIYCYRGEHANHCTTDAVLYRFHCITSVRHNGDGILLFLVG